MELRLCRDGASLPRRGDAEALVPQSQTYPFLLCLQVYNQPFRVFYFRPEKSNAEMGLRAPSGQYYLYGNFFEIFQEKATRL